MQFFSYFCTMKLSILIPTYNYDCFELVCQLKEQLPADAEIIVGDDCSPVTNSPLQTDKINALPRCRVWRAERNLGRAAIRNALAREATGEWLLFIDGDASVRSQKYINDYLQAAEGAPVVCGGTGNLPSCPHPDVRLRYDYEVKAEKRLTLPYRRLHAYSQFTTFNFMILRSLFLSILFDENCRQYGHEDTLFGLQLKERGTPVCHIDNKLTHLGLEPADLYLKKTETALRTLSSLNLELRQEARVSALSMRLDALHLRTLTSFLFRMCRPLLRRNLLSRHPSQWFFTFYKLGYYTAL